MVGQAALLQDLHHLAEAEAGLHEGIAVPEVGGVQQLVAAIGFRSGEGHVDGGFRGAEILSEGADFEAIGTPAGPGGGEEVVHLLQEVLEAGGRQSQDGSIEEGCQAIQVGVQFGQFGLGIGKDQFKIHLRALGGEPERCCPCRR